MRGRVGLFLGCCFALALFGSAGCDNSDDDGGGSLTVENAGTIAVDIYVDDVMAGTVGDYSVVIIPLGPGRHVVRGDGRATSSYDYNPGPEVIPFTADWVWRIGDGLFKPYTDWSN